MGKKQSFFQIGENLYEALQQFLTLFPELRKAPLTIAGESYAGKHIPSLGVQIHWHKEEKEPINLHVEYSELLLALNDFNKKIPIRNL